MGLPRTFGNITSPAPTSYLDDNFNALVSYYVTSAAFYGMDPAASAATNKTALEAAIAALGGAGGIVYIPAGAYSVAAGITIDNTNKNVTICGAGSGMGYEAPTAGTSITFGSGTSGFDCTTIVSGGNYTLLKNMSISGGGVCQYGINANGLILIEHLNVTGCTVAGIWLNDFINSTKLSHVSAVGNASAYGILVGTSNGNSTTFSFDHVVCRSNLIGLRIQNAAHANFANMVLESNTQEGLQIQRVTGSALGNLWFNNVHIENNWAGTSNYNVVIDSFDPTTPANRAQYLQFDNCIVSCSGSTKAINLNAGQYITFNDFQTDATAAIDLATNAAYTVFRNKNGGVITDSGNRNFTIEYDSDDTGGLQVSKPVLQPQCLANYIWDAWNPSDVAGSFTNGPGTGTSTTSSNYYSVGNSSGTVTVTFAIPGTFLVTVTLSASSAAAYTQNDMKVTFGGTASRKAARTTYNVTGEADTDADYAGSITVAVVASAAAQTLTVLPAGRVVQGGGTASNYDLRSELSVIFLGQ